MTTATGPADRFYAAVLGYTLTAPDGTTPTASPGRYALLNVTGRPVAGRLHLPPDLAELLGARWMTYFARPDIDTAAAHAADLGGTVLLPPPTPPPAASPRCVTQPEPSSPFLRLDR